MPCSSLRSLIAVVPPATNRNEQPWRNKAAAVPAGRQTCLLLAPETGLANIVEALCLLISRYIFLVIRSSWNFPAGTIQYGRAKQHLGCTIVRTGRQSAFPAGNHCMQNCCNRGTIPLRDLSSRLNSRMGSAHRRMPCGTLTGIVAYDD